MCFNESASLFALAVGVTFTAVLINHGKIAYAGVLFFIAIMQFYEYLAHLSIRTNNARLNLVAACLIYFGLAIQPLTAAYFNANFKPVGGTFSFPSIFRTWPFTAAYILAVVWVWYKIRNFIKVSYVGTCGTICRLNWFPDAPLFPLVLFLFAFVGYYNIYTISYDGFINPTRLILYFFIASMIYTFFVKTPMKQRLGFFGSIWCFLAVFAGPMYLV